MTNTQLIWGVYASEPNYRSVIPLTQPKALPLGAILVADLEVGAGALIGLLRAAEMSPWSPMCLRLGNQPADAGLIRAARLLPDSVSYLTAESLSWLAGEVIANSIRRRDRPSRAQVSDYLLRRNGWQGREAQAVRQSVEGDDSRVHSANHRSTIWRRLMTIGAFTQTDWSDLATMAINCADSSPSYERLALKCGWDGKTLRKRGKQLVGPLFDRRGELAGWEWIVEAGLRKAGYLSGPYTIPPVVESRSETA